MRGSVFITVKFTVSIMIIMVIITAINTVISFRDLSRWSCDHRCMWGHGQAQAVVGRHVGPWAGTGSGGEAYGDMSRHVVWWGGLQGHGQAQWHR